MKIYYEFWFGYLFLYTAVDKKQMIAKIPCGIGDNLLLTIEDHFESENINYEFNELIPL
jgi:hypothetical protein